MKQLGNTLAESCRIQNEASLLGFDWPDIASVLDKVKEELNEVEEALTRNDFDHAKTELGDILFATVNLARHLHANPEEELHKANVRFTRRFAALNKKLERLGRAIHTCALDELNHVWEQVKKEMIDDDKKGLT